MDNYYLVERENEDHTWFDTSTFSGTPELSRFNADNTDKEIPRWAKANPQKRIVCVQLTEILS